MEKKTYVAPEILVATIETINLLADSYHNASAKMDNDDGLDWGGAIKPGENHTPD